MTDPALEQAYAECQALARRHYENFPVGSRLLPRALRRPVTVIYTFARTADDLADEGDLTAAERLAGLQELADMLDGITAGTTQNDCLGRALADVLSRHQLPIQLFHDLLNAFRQDVIKTRYENFGEVMEYCRRSANPIGRLLLRLHGDTDARHLAYSDAICSALQLINFYQDLHQDYSENGRIYIPRDELERFGVCEDQLREQRTDPALQRLMQLQYERAQRLLRSGAPLVKSVPGRFGFELRLIVLGGQNILQQLIHNPQNAFARPRLKTSDWLGIGWHALRGR